MNQRLVTLKISSPFYIMFESSQLALIISLTWFVRSSSFDMVGVTGTLGQSELGGTIKWVSKRFIGFANSLLMFKADMSSNFILENRLKTFIGFMSSRIFSTPIFKDWSIHKASSNRIANSSISFKPYLLNLYQSCYILRNSFVICFTTPFFS